MEKLNLEQTGDIDRIRRLPSVLALLGISRSTLYQNVKNGTFPQPVKLGARAVGWRDSDIQKLIREGVKR